MPSPAQPGEDAPEPRPTSSRRVLLVRAVTTVVVALFVFLVARRMDLRGFGRALTTASVVPLVVAAALNIGIQLARAGYWRSILWPRAKIPLRTMFRYTIAASGASLVLPARGGEALRVWWLHHRHAIPLAVAGAAFALEKMLDVMTLMLVIAPLPWLLPSERWLAPVRVVTPLALLGSVAVLLVARGGRRRLRWLADLRLFDDLIHVGEAYTCVLAAWLLDVGIICLAMHSVQIPLRLDAAMLVLLTVNLAVAVPAAPGNIGTLELGATFALTTLGVQQERAAAFALLYHGVQIVPLVAISSVNAAVVRRGRPATEMPR
jgi:glycosyltransferase 2 family protein